MTGALVVAHFSLNPTSSTEEVLQPLWDAAVTKTHVR